MKNCQKGMELIYSSCKELHISLEDLHFAALGTIMQMQIWLD